MSILMDIFENIVWTYLPLEDMISYSNLCTRTRKVYLNINTWKYILKRDYKIQSNTNNPMNEYIWNIIEHIITEDYKGVSLNALDTIQLGKIITSKYMTTDKNFSQEIVKQVVDSYGKDSSRMSLDDIYLRTKQIYIRYIREYCTGEFNLTKKMILSLKSK
jgi:hypothetical protein